MMTMQLAAAEQKKEQGAVPLAAAHSPLEPIVFTRGFAASALKN